MESVDQTSADEGKATDTIYPLTFEGSSAITYRLMDELDVHDDRNFQGWNYWLFRKLNNKVYLVQVGGLKLGYVFEWNGHPFSPELSEGYRNLVDMSWRAQELAAKLELREEVVDKLDKARAIFKPPVERWIGNSDWLSMVADLHYLAEDTYRGKTIAELTGNERLAVADDLRGRNPGLRAHDEVYEQAWSALEALTTSS